jgi:threonine aldolase
MAAYSFKNDYSELGHGKVFADLLEVAREQLAGYGMDRISAEARELIRRRFSLGTAAVYFLSGGTQTNLVLANATLRPVEAVIAADSAHPCVHECGAVEHGGNKILTAANRKGKLLPCDVATIFNAHSDEHMVRPKLVFISQATEKGTVYAGQELKSLFEVCKKLGLYLYIDGARLGNALVSDGTDINPEDVGKLCDAFYIGGTKNGSPLGEALCIVNEDLKQNFQFYLKQHGALLAKGGLIGSCFRTLFEDDLFFDLARRANRLAQKLAQAFVDRGYEMSADSPTNQIFPILPNAKIAELRELFEFYVWEKVNDANSAIRLVCSWATDENEVDRLIAAL